MKTLDIQDVIQYVQEHIGEFHQQRLQRLKNLKLNDVLKKKNPYLFRTKNLTTPETIIHALTDAFVSSNEETIFGDWLEGLAIFINRQVYNGTKSGIPGIDLEFENSGIRYIVSIKSGPNWGNSGQIKKMKEDFISAMRTLRTSSQRNMHIVAVNGCCYGRDNKPDKGGYYKYCGQEFWKFISGNPNLYTEIIEPLGYEARKRNEDFQKEYDTMITRFAFEFSKIFCFENGEINWRKLVEFNSKTE